MPFVLSYTMMTGTGQLEASTPDEAIEMHRLLQLAGGGMIEIADHAGKACNLSDLVRLIEAAKGSRDRSPSA